MEEDVKFTDLVDSADQQQKQAQKTSQAAADKRANLVASIRTRQAVTDGLESLARVLTAHEPNVVVKNIPKPLKSIDVPQIAEVVTKLQALIDLENKEDYQPVITALDKLQAAVEALPAKITIPETEKVESVSVDNQIDYGSKFDSLEAAVKGIEVQPKVDLKPNIKVNNDLPELKNVTEAVQEVVTAVNSIKIPDAPKVDMKPLKDAVDRVYDAIAGLTFPSPNYVLPFKDSTGKAVQASVDASGQLSTANPGLFNKPYDELVITYTDSTKNTVSTLVSKLSGAAQQTITLAQTTTTDDYTRA